MYNWPVRKYLRLKSYDYSQNGFYYITICTKERENFFGEIIDWKMILNEYWKIAENFWKEIIFHYQNVEIDEFIIMPNHIHWIIIIFENNIVGNEYFHSKYFHSKYFNSKYFNKMKTSGTKIFVPYGRKSILKLNFNLC